MRHRFHSICPYFAMFPETFVEKHLAATRFDGVVFDPFCGRGTTIFESLVRQRNAAGCDVNPVAYCISGAKSDAPTLDEVQARLNSLEEESASAEAAEESGELQEFFSLCFDSETFAQLSFLRRSLDWSEDRVDRFIAAVCLGALHGESHRSPNYFSNRMPRTISTKPAYSVRWWRANGYAPPQREVFSILRHVVGYRFRTPPPSGRGEVSLSDARSAARSFSHLEGKVTDVITSPPYVDTTNYREDQWLRLWFLGEPGTARQPSGDGRHYSFERYRKFLTEAWSGIGPLLANRARLVVRIGGRNLSKGELFEALSTSMREGIGRGVRLADQGVSSTMRRTQSSSFRGTRGVPAMEHDFVFLVG